MPKDSYFTLIPLLLWPFPAEWCHLFQRRMTCDNNVEPLSLSLVAVLLWHLPAFPCRSFRGQWISAQLGVIFNKYVHFSASVFPFSYASLPPWALWYITQPKTRRSSEWWVTEWATLMREPSAGQLLSVGMKMNDIRLGVWFD